MQRVNVFISYTIYCSSITINVENSAAAETRPSALVML